jgi:hypothetical protein
VSLGHCLSLHLPMYKIEINTYMKRWLRKLSVMVHVKAFCQL